VPETGRPASGAPRELPTSATSATCGRAGSPARSLAPQGRAPSGATTAAWHLAVPSVGRVAAMVAVNTVVAVVAVVAVAAAGVTVPAAAARVGAAPADVAPADADPAAPGDPVADAMVAAMVAGARCSAVSARAASGAA
jgi:hypothetical protein